VWLYWSSSKQVQLLCRSTAALLSLYLTSTFALLQLYCLSTCLQAADPVWLYCRSTKQVQRQAPARVQLQCSMHLQPTFGLLLSIKALLRPY
jgi:hypothetical protein